MYNRAKTALDTCYPATERRNSLVDERGQPYRSRTLQSSPIQWNRFYWGASHTGLKDPSQSSEISRKRATALVTWLWICTSLHFEGRAIQVVNATKRSELDLVYYAIGRCRNEASSGVSGRVRVATRHRKRKRSQRARISCLYV